MIDLPPVIEQCRAGVDGHLVAAIITVESAGDPWAIGVNVRAGQAAPVYARPRNGAEAVSVVERLLAQGYSVDMGLMQVNSQHLARFGLSVAATFEPCTNINAGARVYREFATAVRGEVSFSTPRQQLEAALSAYNTGSFRRGFQNGYVRRVMTVLQAHWRGPMNAFFATPENATLDVAFTSSTPEETDMDRHITADTRRILALATEAPIDVAFAPDQAEALGAFEETALSLEDAEAARVGTEGAGHE